MRRALLWLAVTACISPIGAFARGRSFPIEVTGIVRSVDGATQTFALDVDEPVEVLKIGLRNDCKLTGILKPGTHARISYFATIFAGNLAVRIEMNPKPELARGVIEKIEPADRRLTLRLNPSGHLALRWATDARFVNVTRADLTEGTSVEVSYYSPTFARKYAVRVEAQSPPFNSPRSGQQ